MCEKDSIDRLQVVRDRLQNGPRINRQENKQRAHQLGWRHIVWNAFYGRHYGLPPGETLNPRGTPNQVDDWPWGSTAISRQLEGETP